MLELVSVTIDVFQPDGAGILVTVPSLAVCVNEPSAFTTRVALQLAATKAQTSALVTVPSSAVNVNIDHAIVIEFISISTSLMSITVCTPLSLVNVYVPLPLFTKVVILS